MNENTSSGRPVGRAVLADDGDGDKRTYKLVAATPNDDASEAAAAKFDINPSTGQILTKDLLNTEAVCSDDDSGLTGGDQENLPTTVVVVVRDGLDANKNKEAKETAADDTITVTITVKDVAERPSAPIVVLRSPEDVTELGVMWYTDNTGPPITSYALQYKKGSDAWSSDNCRNTNTPAITAGTDSCMNINPAHGSVTIEELTANTQYSVRMQATNDEGRALGRQQSRRRRTRTNRTILPTLPPTFVDTSPNLEVNESHERSAQDVGASRPRTVMAVICPISLESPNKNLFTINSSGLIKTRSGLNHENPLCDYDDTAGSDHVQLQSVGEGWGWPGRKHLSGVYDNYPGRGRAYVRAVRAEGDGDDRLGQEPGRDLERAGQHGASHHRLRHTVSRGRRF